MESEQTARILRTLKKEHYSFGESLRYVRKTQGLTVRGIAQAVHKTPTYISDIERGNNKAPEVALIKALIEALSLDESATELTNHLYDLAAWERKEVAGDIAGYIMEQDTLRTAIRLAKRNETDGKIWEECIIKMK